MAKIDFRKLWTRVKWKRKNADVYKLFIKRSKIFTQKTAEILVNMDSAMQGIAEYMKFKKAFDQNAVLEWREVSLVGNNVDDALIILIGVLNYPPGSTVELTSGEKIEVNANTTEYFQRLVRIGLPLKYAQTSKQIVMEYLKQADELNEKELKDVKDVVQEILGKQDILDKKNNIPTEPPAVVKKKNDTTNVEGFDLTQLTEEQKKNLIVPIK